MSKLKPGVHFMQGDRLIKSVSLTDAEEWNKLFGLETRTQGAEALLASVGWVFVALNERGDMIGQIAIDWERDKTKVETLPFNFDTYSSMTRIDQALELRGQAYLLKQRVGSRLVGLRWLDPAAVTPSANSLTVDGYTRFDYNTNKGIIPIPAEDVIRFLVAGQREHDPAPAASKATSLAAQILLGMSETTDTFYDTNGLPVVAVIVPEMTMEGEVERTRSAFERIFNRRRNLDGNKTIGLRSGSDVKTISFAPKDLAMAELDLAKREEILLAHGVSPALTYRDVNRAEAELKLMQFVGKIGGRLEKIAQTINEDEDVARFGITLVPHPERHEAMQKWELDKAESLQRLAGVPVISVNEARERLELDPVPGGDMIAFDFGASEEPTGESNQPPMEADATDDAKALEIDRLRRYAAKGKHLKRPFTSDILTPIEILGVIADEVGNAPDAPFWQGYP
jgi:hypothetical protein